MLLMTLGMKISGGEYLEKGITFSWAGFFVALVSSVTSGLLVNIIYRNHAYQLTIAKSFIYSVVSMLLFLLLQVMFTGTEITINIINRNTAYVLSIYFCIIIGLQAGLVMLNIANKSFKKDAIKHRAF